MDTNADNQAPWTQTKAMLGDRRLLLGPYFTYQLFNTPRRVLFALSHYKFAAKLIGTNKRILEVGCSEGLGTLILAEFASECLAIDTDVDAVKVAKEALESPRLQFRIADVCDGPFGEFDAVASFDVIEHIPQEQEEKFLCAIAANLAHDGMAILGTPNITSDQYASPVTRSGHVNLFSAERLQSFLDRFFRTVLIFSANDEMIHTGYTPLAYYLLGIGIGLKKPDA